MLITKRMVGVALFVFGLLGAFGALAVDIIGAGNWDGLGPAQQTAIGIGLLTSLLGVSLIPLGARPA